MHAILPGSRCVRAVVDFLLTVDTACASIFIVCGGAGAAKLAEPRATAKPAPSKSGFIFSSMPSDHFCKQNGQSRGGFRKWRNYGRQPSKMIWSAQREATLRFFSVRTVQVSNGSPNIVRASRGAAAGRSLTE